jgi:hypothetical protein
MLTSNLHILKAHRQGSTLTGLPRVLDHVDSRQKCFSSLGNAQSMFGMNWEQS